MSQIGGGPAAADTDPESEAGIKGLVDCLFSGFNPMLVQFRREFAVRWTMAQMGEQKRKLMKHRQRVRAIRLASAAAIGWSAACGGGGDVRAESAMLGAPDLALERAATLREFAFAHEGVLGTSMDLVVQAPRARDAVECERRALAEIERLRAILSTYDAASEIRRVMAGGAVESAELAEVLDAYASWGTRSNGAIELNMAG